MPNSPSITEASLTQWQASLREGDGDATRRLWDLYFERMVAVARRKLSGAKRAARDEEDIALSAFHSFCRGFQQGRFEHANRRDPNNLWPLLVTLTLNKAVDQIRHENRQKRGGSGEASAVRWTADAPVLLDQLACGSPQPELIAIAEESVERLLNLIDETGDEDLGAVVMASIEGQGTPEIASQLKCSQRTVQRKLRTARELWEADSG